ncbi:MAG: transcriptional regulator, LuxR family [Polaromonas sp.]|nr:transcriptional regulator, LuxR family [Polaromonas sp.]
MHAHSIPLTEGTGHYLKLIEGISIVRRHFELLQWLQNDIQHYLPHEILLVGWGNFPEGVIHHDILSKLPGVRSYAVGTDSLPFLLGKFYDCWISGGKKPIRLDFCRFEYLLGNTSLPGSFTSALRRMRSVLIHGMCDERGQYECLYVMLSTQPIPEEPASTAIKVLMPFIDSALRQVTHLPQQKKPSPKPLRTAHEEAFGLSEREIQIMDWVAMGKTNSEIGSILNISGFTVKNHMQRIFQKLNVFNRAQAVSKINGVIFNG